MTVIAGLTGGIGTGKSTVLRLFGELGAEIISADAIVHELLASDAGVLKRIREEFGDGVLDESGSVDRALLGRRVFADAALRARLEAIVHPLVRERIGCWMSAVRAAGRPAGVAEVPLLFEAGMEDDFDLSVLVISEPAVQLRRLLNRGLSVSEAQTRISSQMPLSEKIARADIVIPNDGSLEELSARVERLWRPLCEGAGRPFCAGDGGRAG